MIPSNPRVNKRSMINPGFAEVLRICKTDLSPAGIVAVVNFGDSLPRGVCSPKDDFSVCEYATAAGNPPSPPADEHGIEREDDFHDDENHDIPFHAV